MKPQAWAQWLESWFRRHPVRPPVPPDPDGYRQEVMARIQALEAPAPRPMWRRLLEPRPALALGGLCAAALFLLLTVSRPAERGPIPEIEAPLQTWETLFELGETAALPDEFLLEELRETDRILLAEALSEASSPASGEIPLEEELLLLEELDALPEETLPEEALTDEEWLDLLNRLDRRTLEAVS